MGLIDINLVSQLVDFLIQKNGAGAVKFLNEVLEKGKDSQEFAKTLISYLRQALILKINPDLINPVMGGLTPEERQRLLVQSQNFKEVELHRALKLFMEAENKMKYSSISQLPLELAIIEFIG